MKKFREYSVDLHQIFFNFKQLYDSIGHTALNNILSQFKIPEKPIRLIRMTMSTYNAQVKPQNQLTKYFDTDFGLKQDDRLALVDLSDMLLYKPSQTVT